MLGCVLIGAAENGLGSGAGLVGEGLLPCWVLCRLGQASGAQAEGWGELKVLAGPTFLTQLSSTRSPVLGQINQIISTFQRDSGKDLQSRAGAALLSRFWFWCCCDQVVELLCWSSGLGRLAVFMTLAG